MLQLQTAYRNGRTGDEFVTQPASGGGASSVLLLESGDTLLLESGDRLMLE